MSRLLINGLIVTISYGVLVAQQPPNPDSSSSQSQPPIVTEQSRPNQFHPEDYMRLIAISSACACMVLVIFGFLILVVKDKITAEIIGTPGRAAAGSGGLIGMIIVFYKVIVAVLPRAPGVQ